MEPSNTCICHGERIDLSPRQAAEWPSHWQRRNATSGPHPLPLYAADLWPCVPASGDQVHGRRRPHGHDVRVDDRVRLARRHRERVALQGRGGAAGGEMCHKSPAPAGQPCPAAGQDHETCNSPLQSSAKSQHLQQAGQDDFGLHQREVLSDAVARAEREGRVGEGVSLPCLVAHEALGPEGGRVRAPQRRRRVQRSDGDDYGGPRGDGVAA